MDKTPQAASQTNTRIKLCQHYQLKTTFNEGGWPLINTTPDGRTCIGLVPGEFLLLLDPTNVISEGTCKRQIEAGTCPMRYTKESLR